MEAKAGHIYVINGLGNNALVAKTLRLEAFPHSFVEWYDAYDAETLKIYVKRLKWQIRAESPVLIGIFFGGLVAVELGKILAVRKIILISAPCRRAELPGFIKNMAPFSFHKVPLFRNIISRFWINKLSKGLPAGIEAQVREQFEAGMQDLFSGWAIRQVFAWPARRLPEPMVQIHGSHDELIPSRGLKKPHLIESGKHLMIFSKPDVVAQALHLELNLAVD